MDNPTNQEPENTRRKWLTRALFAAPVAAYALGSLQNIEEVHAATNIDLDQATITQTVDNDTKVTLITGRKLWFFGDNDSNAQTEGVLVASNNASSGGQAISGYTELANSDGNAISAWHSAGGGIGLITAAGLGTNDGTGLKCLGRAGIGKDPEAMVDIDADDIDPLIARAQPPSGAPASFVVDNTTSGNSKCQFTFRGNGTNKYSLGNDVNADNSQNFFIYNEVSGRLPLYMDSSDIVHGTFQASDLIFDNSYRITEDPNDGLAFLNPQGNKIAVLDKEGNLRIKGKVIEEA